MGKPSAICLLIKVEFYKLFSSSFALTVSSAVITAAIVMSGFSENHSLVNILL